VVKPLIQKVYIDENQPFPYLASVLSARHNFHPTYEIIYSPSLRLKLYRHLSEHARRLIRTIGNVNSLAKSRNGVSGRMLADPNDEPSSRICRAESWKMWRRTKIDESNRLKSKDGVGNNRRKVTVYTAFLVRRSTLLVGFLFCVILIFYGSKTVVTDNLEHSLFETRSGYGMDHAPVVTAKNAPSPSFVARRLRAVSAGDHVEACDDGSKASLWHHWPFDWAAVNVPGSPGLWHLFEVLEIECSLPVPPLSLDAEESQHISDIKMQDLFNTGNKHLVYDIDMLPPRRQRHSLHQPSKKYIKQIAARHRAPAFHAWTESPLDEIYVFPQSPKIASLNSPASRLSSWASLASRGTELQIKFSKLGQLLHPDHPAVIQVMEDPASIHLEQRKYGKGEELSRRVVHARLRTLGPTHLKTLSANLDLAIALLHNGWYDNALTLLLALQPTIFEHAGYEDDLANLSMILMADA
jgi:hypothetical protein